MSLSVCHIFSFRVFFKSSEDLKSQRETEREREREGVSRVFQISFICFFQGCFKGASRMFRRFFNVC